MDRISMSRWFVINDYYWVREARLFSLVLFLYINMTCAYIYICACTCLHLSPSVWLDLCMHVQYVDAEEYKGTELHAGDVNDDPCWPSLSFRKHQPNPPDETGAGICYWLDLPDDQPSRPLASWVLRTEPHVAKNQCARNLSCFTC